METGHAEALMPMIERVMRAGGLSFGEIDRIVVTNGPGTFTGVRTGVAAARALALATGAKLIGVSSLWPAGLFAPTRIPACSADTDAVIVAMDARKGMVYAEVIDIAGRELTGPHLLSAEAAAGLAPGYALFAVGTAANDVAAAGAAAGRAIWTDRDGLLLPEHHFANAVQFIAYGDREACAGPLQPLYLRAADAKPQTAKSLPWSTS